MKLILTLLLTLVGLAEGETKHNFLWVVDNSASMEKQRALVDQNFGEFIRRLENQGITKWQMGITSTDFFDHQGHLYPKEFSAPALITSEMEDPASIFSQYLATVVDSSTSFWEQGLEASIATLKTFPETFMVSGEPLTIIYISDEDDYSCAEDCVGVQPENNSNWKAFSVDRYTSFFNSLNKEKGIEVSIFPIVGILEGNCSVPSYGVRYLKLRANVQSGNGIAGSVCESDVVNSLLAIPERLGMTVTDPPGWTLDPIQLTAKEEMPFTADLSAYATGNHLTFSKIGGPDWLGISHSGTLSGTPSLADVGSQSFIIRVTDEQGASADVTLVVRVTHTNHGPVWKVSPIVLDAVQVGSPFMVNLGEYVTDPDGDPLTFSLILAPGWIVLDSITGAMRGTPGQNDVGASEIRVVARDGGGSAAMNTIILKVLP